MIFKSLVVRPLELNGKLPTKYLEEKVSRKASLGIFFFNSSINFNLLFIRFSRSNKQGAKISIIMLLSQNLQLPDPHPTSQKLLCVYFFNVSDPVKSLSRSLFLFEAMPSAAATATACFAGSWL